MLGLELLLVCCSVQFFIMYWTLSWFMVAGFFSLEMFWVTFIFILLRSCNISTITNNKAKTFGSVLYIFHSLNIA